MNKLLRSRMPGIGASSKRLLVSSVGAAFFTIFVSAAQSEIITSLKGAGPKFPKVGEKYELAYKALLTEISKGFPEIDFEIHSSPIPRAIRALENGTLDFYYPVFCQSKLNNDGIIRNGSETSGYIPIALFSRKNDPINSADIESATYRFTPRSLQLLESHFNALELKKLSEIKNEFQNKNDLIRAVGKTLEKEITKEIKEDLARATYKYVIETDRAQVPHFDIIVHPSISIENSIKKLSRGRIDGYLMPPLQFEAIVAEVGISDDFHRAIYRIHSACYLVENSERGRMIDKILQKGFQTVKQNGTYDRLLGQNDKDERAWVENQLKQEAEKQN